MFAGGSIVLWACTFHKHAIRSAFKTQKADSGNNRILVKITDITYFP